MWLHSVARRACAVDAREHALALVQLARERLEHERLVVAEAHDVDHLRAAVAVLALDHAARRAPGRRRWRRTATRRAWPARGRSPARRAPTAVACSVVS